MPFQNDLKLTYVDLGLKGTTPDQVFRNMSWKLSAHSDLSSSSIADALSRKTDRDDLNFGDGLIICDWLSEGIDQSVVSLFSLEKPIQLGADDTQFMDMILVLISPESESITHLRHLARLTRLFRDESLLQHIREAHSEDVVFSLMQKENRKLMAA